MLRTLYDRLVLLPFTGHSVLQFSQTMYNGRTRLLACWKSILRTTLQQLKVRVAVASTTSVLSAVCCWVIIYDQSRNFLSSVSCAFLPGAFSVRRQRHNWTTLRLLDARTRLYLLSVGGLATDATKQHDDAAAAQPSQLQQHWRHCSSDTRSFWPA